MLQRFLAGPVRWTIGRFPIFVNKLSWAGGAQLGFLLPVIGALQFCARPRAARFWWPLLALIGVGAVHAIVGADVAGSVRLVHLGATFYFGQFLAEHFDAGDFVRIEKVLLCLAAAYLIGEHYWVGPMVDKEVLPGVMVPRLLGLTGESNYSGILCALVALAFGVRGQWGWALLGAVTVLFTCSRISVLLLFVGSAWPLWRRWPERRRAATAKLLLLILLAYPLWVLALDALLTMEGQAVLNRFYSGRFTIHGSYLAMLGDHPWGVGYFGGPGLFHHYAELGSRLAAAGGYLYGIHHAPVYQQHNLLLQVLTEFGYLGYGIFAFFLWRALTNALSAKNGADFLFMCLLLGFLTLNGLSNFAFIFGVVRFSLKANMLNHTDAR